MENTNRNDRSGQIFALLFMAYAVSYVGRKSYSACMNDICAEFEIGKSFAGLISTGYLSCYGAGQLLSGFTADRLSPKKMIAIGLLGAGLANLLTGFSGSARLLMVFWCLNGAFQSMLWSPVVRAIAEWLPDAKKSFAGTTISITLPIGTALSYLASSAALRFLNWRAAFLFAGFLMLLCAGVWLWGCTKEAPYIRTMQAEKAAARTGETKSGAAAGAKPMVSLFFCIVSCGLLMTMAGLFCNGILKDGITEWIPGFLSENCGVSASAAAFFVTLMPLINIPGSYIGSWLTKRHTHNEMLTGAVLFGAATLSAFGIFGLYSLLLSNGRGTGLGMALLCVLLFAVITLAMQGANNMFLTFIPLHFAAVGRSASVTGFLNAFAYLAAAVSGIFSGRFLESAGWTALVVFWLSMAAAGVPICLLGGKTWAKGRERLEKAAAKK